jgi:hypothetical protein
MWISPGQNTENSTCGLIQQSKFNPSEPHRFPNIESGADEDKFKSDADGHSLQGSCDDRLPTHPSGEMSRRAAIVVGKLS